MADRIKGITVEIGGDVTGLNKALQSTNKEINSTQSQLKDVERLLKLDPTNTELLAQKQRLLGEAINGTKEKLAVLKEAESQAQEQFAKGEISQQQYEGLKREIVATEAQLKKLEQAAQQTNGTLATIAETAKKVGDAAGTVADKTKALSLAAGGAAAGLVGLAAKAGLAADDLNTLAKQSGFGTDEIQKWQYAADRIDVSVDDIVKAAGKMKKNMVSTSKDTVAAWEQLGVSVTDGAGELRDSTEVFYEAVEALSRIENETERDVVAMQLFGKSADSLAGIIDDGGAALKEFGKEAEDAGLILSQDALDGANAFNDGLDTIKAKATAAAMSAGASLAENLLPAMDTLVDKISGVVEWVAKLDGRQLKLLVTILAVVAAISPMAKMIQGISSAVGVVTTVISTVSGGLAIFTGTATTGTAAAQGFAGALTFITGPAGVVIAIIAAIVAAVVLLWNNCEGFREAVTTAWTIIQQAFQSFMDWLQATFAPLWDAIVGAMGTVFDTFKQAMAAAWAAMTQIFQIFSDFLTNTFGVTWDGTFTEAQAIFETVGQVIQEIVGVLTQVFEAWITFVTTVFLSQWQSAFQNLVNFITAFKGNVEQVVEGVKTLLSGIITFVTGVFTGDWTKAWKGVQDIFRGIFEALVGIVKLPINGIISILNGALGAVNGLIAGVNKLLDGLRAVGVKVPVIPSIPTIAYLAKGGILEAGNAIVGEKGPELLSLTNGKARVTPLDGAGSPETAAAVPEYNQTLNFYTAAMTPSEVARQTRNASKKMLAGVRR